MIFNFRRFFESRQIHYIERGNNVQDGNINIKCPFCGPLDPSQHLGIEEATGVWGCWRNDQHRGQRPHKLIMRLLNCTFAEADALVKEGVEQTGDTWSVLKEKLGTVPLSNKKPSKEELPMFDGVQEEGLKGRFFRYVMKRGFTKEEAKRVVDEYDLRCCLHGEYAGRLIIPFYFEGKYVGGTARAVGKSDKRFLSYPHGATIKTILYNYDAALYGGNALFVVEGPVDTIKVDFFVKKKNCAAVGLLGTGFTQKQIVLLQKLQPLYNNLFLLLDADAISVSLRLQQYLPGSKILVLPEGVKDPGDLTKNQVLALLS